MKLKDWLRKNKKSFSDSDLRFLLKDCVLKGYPFALAGEVFLENEEIHRLKSIKKEYSRGVPLAYILGKESFFGLEFEVDNRVLIPRKETELITEKAIDIINNSKLFSVLDLCCGPCNIAISVKELVDRNVVIFASDISWSALEVAKDNLINYNASINLINSDLLSSFKSKSFDIIVSNPPYVEEGYLRNNLSYEPEVALSAGNDGLYFIEKILEQAPSCLYSKGYLIMEFGYNHKSNIANLVRKRGCYNIKEWIRDYSGHWRGVVLQLV